MGIKSCASTTRTSDKTSKNFHSATGAKTYNKKLLNTPASGLRLRIFIAFSKLTSYLIIVGSFSDTPRSRSVVLTFSI